MVSLEEGAPAVRRFGSGWVFFALSIAIVVISGEARGQALPPTARAAEDQARQAYAAGRKQEAIEGFKRAYELSGDPSLLFRLGEVSRELGQDVAALRFYRTYLARDPAGTYREAAERASRSLELGGTKPVPTPVASPAPPNRAAAPAPAPPPSPPPAPLAPATATPVVDLRAGASAPSRPPSGSPLPSWLPWAGVGATVALSAGAVVSGLGASRRFDDLRASCGRTPEGCSQSQIDEVKSRALTTNLLWAAAGVGAVATGVMFYVNAREAGVSGVVSF